MVYNCKLFIKQKNVCKAVAFLLFQLCYLKLYISIIWGDLYLLCSLSLFMFFSPQLPYMYHFRKKTQETSFIFPLFVHLETTSLFYWVSWAFVSINPFDLVDSRSFQKWVCVHVMTWHTYRMCIKYNCQA